MLTVKTKENIINSLELRKFQNWFKGSPEHTMNFEECDDETLIYYRDEWLVSEFDLNDRHELQLISVWYDEDVFDYWSVSSKNNKGEWVMLKIGDKFILSDIALENYGEEYRDIEFTVSYVATNIEEHQGYDESMDGIALYEADELNYAVYEYEIEEV